MIGKPEWFKYRVFGWGIAPKTWQGWAYVAAMAAIVAGVTAMGITDALKGWIVGVIIGLFVLDALHIMLLLPKFQDERENHHQLLIERNCSFAAIAALICVALYQTYQHRALFQTGVSTAIPFDWSIAVVLGVMLVAKVASTAYVKWKM